MLIRGLINSHLERIHDDFGRITSDNVDPGVNQQSTWKVCNDFGRITSDNVDPGDQLMVNLERICDDFGRITSDNVDPGGQSTVNLERIHNDLGGSPLTMLILEGMINSQLGKDLQ